MTDQRLSLGERISALAEVHPDRIAMVFAPYDGPERTIAWRELEESSRRVARLLRARGVDDRSLVAVALRNSPEHFFAAIGAWKLGACVLPLRWDLPPRERDALLDVATPAVVVADWEGGAFPTVRPADLEAAAALPATPFDCVVPDPAMAIASGGSTGRPKVIVTPGSGLAPGVQPENPPAIHSGVRNFVPAGAEQVQLIPSPLYHAAGFRGSHHALQQDQMIVLMERFDAARAVALIERFRITSVNMVPTMLSRIARLRDVGRRDLSSLTSVMASAAATPPWVVRAWCDLVGPEHLVISYGATEFTGMALARGDEWLAHPGTVGRGLGTDIRILDDEGRDLPPGEIGEIYMRPTVDIGPTYQYRGSAPAKSTGDRFVSVGDMGWLDEDGYLYIADRRTDMIVSGGANVFPAEVEAVITEHPAVADAAVFGLPDEEWGHRVCAAVQPADPAQPPEPSELDRHCRERLAGYKVPKSWALVDHLPRTEAGKLNRSALASELPRPVSI